MPLIILKIFLSIFIFHFYSIEAKDIQLEKFILKRYTEQNKEEFLTQSKNRFLKTKFSLEYKNSNPTKYKFSDGVFIINKFGQAQKVYDNSNILNYYKTLDRIGIKDSHAFNIETVYFHKEFGRFIFYNAIKVKNKHSKGTGEIVLWSYGFVNETYEENEKPKFFKEDLETGTFDKNLWDIFSFQGKTYLLLDCINYERWYFELYEITKSKAKFISEIDYGGL